MFVVAFTPRSRSNIASPAGKALPRHAGNPESDPLSEPGLYIGIDLGTSGCRAVAIDRQQRVVASAGCTLPASRIDGPAIEQQPEDWWHATLDVLAALGTQTELQEVSAIAVDGTSSTLLLVDANGMPLTPGIMYNDARAAAEATQLAKLADASNGAQGAGSSMAKLMWLHRHNLDRDAAFTQSQADWIAGRLSGRLGFSDYHNALKLGYDVTTLAWPTWIDRAPIRRELLPEIGTPGETLGTISPTIADRLGINTQAEIKFGTTDSIAAFLATGASRPGQAVTSLGSTLVLKLLAEQPVYFARHGVYSHRLGNLWLVGGASNSGGGALLRYLNPEQLGELTPRLRPDEPTGLNYYPLPGTGERFPENNPLLESRVEPRPGTTLEFFQGLLEGIAAIEARGYRLLEQLGAPYPTEVLSCGGGAGNAGWTQIRSRYLGVPVGTAQSTEAAFGVARLALGVVTT